MDVWLQGPATRRAEVKREPPFRTSVCLDSCDLHRLRKGVGHEQVRVLLALDSALAEVDVVSRRVPLGGGPLDVVRGQDYREWT